ncbi:SIS domain-containing protein [Rubrimonas cliftonensis]|uniref:Glutamine--fructose-6-phosphate transaminase n=1 Tax=Rubrimonas cliftonensis TaxID=89524 RepID=A0A1H4BYK2_9RHOB|nr:SIS domain-containing protein [Rubrimonas cliftonensis]SEA53169.1 glutamine--fructose-6-phosphate transaminase [Rubrimonas cliftonensis]
MNSIPPLNAATHMAREAREAPEVVARQVAEGLPAYREIGARLRAADPRLALTCARGTSDHAATYFRYLCEMRAGVPVATVGPSIGSVYRAPLRLEGALCLTVSQSGGSPDLVALQGLAREGGALAVALLNTPDSPVGAGADMVAPLLAGPEKAVAATKSYIASLVAIAAIVAEWTQDAALSDGLERLPEAVGRAMACDWSAAMTPLAGATSVFTLGRGLSLSVANESALKFKETCRLHAEAYSAAEVRHGPIALAERRFAALVFGARDAGRESLVSAVTAVREAGARAFFADPEASGPDVLPVVAAPHPALDPICQAATFYLFIEALATALGENPDAPKHLKKITETL